MLNLVLKVINMNKYIFGIFLFFTPNIFGQDLTSSYKKSFILELGMPIALTNKAFNNLMKPIIYFSSGYQYKLKSDFRVGGGVHYTYWQINEFRVPPDEPVKGGVHSVGAFIKPTFEKYYSNTFGIDAGVKLGYSQTFFISDYNKQNGVSQQTDALHIAPSFSLVFPNEEKGAVRFSIAYHIQGFGFSPNRIGIQSKAGYEESSFSNPSTYIFIGFGYSFFLK